MAQRGVARDLSQPPAQFLRLAQFVKFLPCRQESLLGRVFTGRKIPERLGEIAQRAGVGILMTLMAVAIFNDIARLMS